LSRRLPASGSLNAGRTALGEGLTNRLREAREARGWTQADLAERVGVSRKTINTVENSVFIPSTIIALKLARALGQPVEKLFSLAE
jgi:putative transcriptional regulator